MALKLVKKSRQDTKVMSEKKFKLPHVFVILFGMLMVATILTWIIPSGSFQYQQVDVEGTIRDVVIPGSYQVIPKSEAAPVGLVGMLSAVHKGMIAAVDVIMLIFIVNGAFSMIIKTGAFNALLGTMLKKLQGKEKILIPALFTLYALLASFFGMWNEFNGLIPIMVGLGVAIGFDGMVGFATMQMGIGIGFAVSIMNPFTVVVAQSLAGVPIYSGAGFRIICSIIFYALGIWWILRYAKKISNDRSKSLLTPEETKFSLNRDELEKNEMTSTHKIILGVVLVALVIIFYGTIKKGWGMSELSGVFLGMGIIAALIDGWNANKIAEEFIDGCRNIVYGALIVGVARATLVVLTDAQIIDTIINFMVSALQGLPSWLAAQGMLVVQTLLNFIVSSGSGQAATILPIMTPIGDLLDVSRQVTVLAYQFGDGFSNLIWPTGGIAMYCALAGIPLQKWWKFIMPLFGIMYVVQMILLFVATVIGI